MNNSQRIIERIKTFVRWLLTNHGDDLIAILSIVLLIGGFVLIKYTRDFSFAATTKTISTKANSADFNFIPFLDKPTIKTTETWKRFISEVQSSNQHETIVFKNIDFHDHESSDEIFGIESITNRIKFDYCTFDRDIDLAGSKIGSITFDTCKVKRIITDHAVISDEFLIRGSEIDSGLSMGYMETGRLEILNTIIYGKGLPEDQPILSADGLKVKKTCRFENTLFEGDLRLRRARISDFLSFERSVIIGNLSLDQTHIDSSLRLKKLSIYTGHLRAPLCTINGNVDLHGSKIIGQEKIKGNETFDSEDEIYFGGSKIQGSFHFKDLSLFDRSNNDFIDSIDKSNNGNLSFSGTIDLSDSRIAAGVYVPDLNQDTEHHLQIKQLDLTSTEVQRFHFDTRFLPDVTLCERFSFKDLGAFGNEKATGTSIGNVADSTYRQNIDACREFCIRTSAVNRQFAIFRKFANCFENHGDTFHAREFRIYSEREKYRIAKNGKSTSHWVWWHVGWIISYGYSPLAALWYIVGWLILSSIVFQSFAYYGRVRESNAGSKNDSHQAVNFWQFNGLIFSMDTFLPFVNLRYADSFVIERKFVLNWFLCFHILYGWFLTTLLVAGVSGLLFTSN